MFAASVSMTGRNATMHRHLFADEIRMLYVTVSPDERPETYSNISHWF